jgi:formylglycine-generating enzyme required for sulfatase activity/uncharacterized caspase-like protein
MRWRELRTVGETRMDEMRRILVIGILLAWVCVIYGEQRGLRKVQLSSGQEVALYSRSYALVIGVQSYTHWDRLINPIRDAHEVGEKLAQQGFEVTYLDDPDSEGLKGRLKAFAYGPAGRDEDARVVVFFAGHGHTEKIASGQRGFIVPRDAPRPEKDMVGFMTRAFSMDDIEQLATGMLAKHVLFVFDSCFSGTLLRGNAHPQPITEKTTKKVRQFITSGSADEQVPDRSIFQASLLNALDGDADITKDGYVTGEELGSYLKGKVMEYSKGTQTPQYGKIKDPNLDQGDVVFVLPELGAGLTTPPPVPITPPPPSAVQFGHLQVNVVNASNSQVYVDGTHRGVTNPGQALNLSNVGLGSVEVRVTANGYQAKEQSFSLMANEWTQAVMELAPVPVAPPPAVKEAPTTRPSSGSGASTTAPGGQTGKSRTFTLPGGARIEMVWIPAGTFTMGSPESEEGRWNNESPQHSVTISQGFWLGKYEVTQAQWKSVMRKNPSYFRGSRLPVEQVSWEGVQVFIEKLNRLAGNSVYRLPTEAEWEFACRAGTTSHWSFGNDESQLREYAWYWINNMQRVTKEVGQKRANPWGLHDMHGNVWEWCQDWYGGYSDGSQVDPMGVSTGSSRVLRGGFFGGGALLTRSANRDDCKPSNRNNNNVGFRLLRVQ